MANEILVKQGTEIVFGVTASFDPADDATNMTALDAITDLLTLSGVLNGAGRQSTKVDLGTPRAPLYSVFAAVDYTGETPTAPGQVDYYWAPSTSGTDANGNIAGNSGADGDAPDGALGTITLAEFLAQCQFIGSLITHDGASVQNGYVGTFSPKERYGQMITVNNGGDAFEADDVEMHTVLKPIITEVQ